MYGEENVSNSILSISILSNEMEKHLTNKIGHKKRHLYNNNVKEN